MVKLFTSYPTSRLNFTSVFSNTGFQCCSYSHQHAQFTFQTKFQSPDRVPEMPAGEGTQQHTGWSTLLSHQLQHLYQSWWHRSGPYWQVGLPAQVATSTGPRCGSQARLVKLLSIFCFFDFFAFFSLFWQRRGPGRLPAHRCRCGRLPRRGVLTTLAARSPAGGVWRVVSRRRWRPPGRRFGA